MAISDAPRAGGRTPGAHFFASCPRGLEELLAAELRGAGIDGPRVGVGGVGFAGPLGAAYRACLWSRIASRVLVSVGEVGARDADEMYAGAVELRFGAAAWAALGKTCELVALKTDRPGHARRTVALHKGTATAFKKAASLATDREDKNWLLELARDAAKQASRNSAAF